MEKRIQPLWLLESIFRPIVRFCLRRSVKAHDTGELLRQLFVQEAIRAIEEANGLVSVSKISVITGINRAEVTRLLSGEERTITRHDLLQRIIGLWTHGARYRNRATNTPRPLTHQGVTSEFAQLVESVSKEVNHYPILFELERIGAIEYQDDRVLLRIVEYTPRGDIEHGLGVLSDDLGDLIDTVETNLTTRAEQPDLHLRTMYDNIDPAKLPAIRKWILARGAAFHAEVATYLAGFDHDLNPDQKPSMERARVVVSSFALGAPIEAVKQQKPRKRGRKKLDQTAKTK